MGPECEAAGGARLEPAVNLVWEMQHCGKLRTLDKLLKLWLGDHNPKQNKVRLPACAGCLCTWRRYVCSWLRPPSHSGLLLLT